MFIELPPSIDDLRIRARLSVRGQCERLGVRHDERACTEWLLKKCKANGGRPVVWSFDEYMTAKEFLQ